MYSRLETTSYCCSRVPYILTTSGMPKKEAIDYRLISKYFAHVRSGNNPFNEKPGNYVFTDNF